MMNVLSITNQKGGVGKTSTAVTIAHGLAKQGQSVLLVDLDAQGNCADALGIEKRPGLYQFLVLDDESAIVTARENLDVITGDKSTVRAQKIITGENFGEYVLRNHLESLGPTRYDIIIIDTAPGAGVLQINALVASTHFLIPVSLAHLATVGAIDVLGTVASLKRVNAFQGRWLGVLPTMWDRTTNESHKQLTEMATRFGRLVWPPIPVDVKAREAPGAGQTLWEYASDCRALNGVDLSDGKDPVGGYAAVVDRLIDEVMPCRE